MIYLVILMLILPIIIGFLVDNEINKFILKFIYFNLILSDFLGLILSNIEHSINIFQFIPILYLSYFLILYFITFTLMKLTKK